MFAALSGPGTAWSATDLLAEPAPDFALKSFSGENLRLSEYRGEVVLVNFWADWCGSCKEQLAAINALYADRADDGFVVLSVNIDKKSAKARKAVSDLRLEFPVLTDDRKRVSKLYDLGRAPLIVLVDPHGVVRHVHEGYQSGDAQSYREEVAALLAE